MTLSCITFVTDDVQFWDYGSFDENKQVYQSYVKEGVVIEAQLQMIPLILGKVPEKAEKTSYFIQVHSNFYEFCGKILKMASLRKNYTMEEVLLDCKIPIRIRECKELLIDYEKSNKVYCKEGDFLSGCGYLYGFISFDETNIFEPVSGKVVKVEELRGREIRPGSFNRFYLITIDISPGFEKPKRHVSLFKP